MAKGGAAEPITAIFVFVGFSLAATGIAEGRRAGSRLGAAFNRGVTLATGEPPELVTEMFNGGGVSFAATGIGAASEFGAEFGGAVTGRASV